MAGISGPSGIAAYARAAEPLFFSADSPANRARLITESLGFRLGPFGIEYSRKDVEFVSATNAGGQESSQAATDAGFAAVFSQITGLGRPGRDKEQSTDQDQGAGAANIRLRGLAAYAAQSLAASAAGSPQSSLLAVV